LNFIPLQNQRLISYLQNLTEVVYSDKLKSIISKYRPHFDNLQPGAHSCDDSYLLKAFELKLEDYGFPRSSLGCGMRDADIHNMEFIDGVQKFVSKIGNFLGTPNNALVMAYPDKGFIGWHHNGNAPGYNILMTYSQDGDGFFKYWDTESKSIVTMPDKKGWSVKVGYYPDQVKARDKVYWHCASTNKQRLSVAWVLDHRGMWENMINTITNGEFDQTVLQQKQMPTI